MENVVLIIHLLLALSLIGAVLLQRSEGGGLGMGGGGGGGGRVAGRSAGTAMGKLTWLLAAAFICTSMALTIIAASNSAGGSVLDRLVDAPARTEAPDETDAASGTLQAPGEDDADAPLLPTAE
ncbi:preprotein translocase subunit SecG [Pelagivirga sediminicola]|uniref:Protein-export membrane protein SecG n=1 Tax=Pelagivirga sediminicola TaxID=2170575 RepID=A0A2T7GC29_9RHOB|nr:preprotein translocase subunit SecG [Pelagivirga sediminicola]PVA11966.1 preprotein translocase subunit SecG [Pelagivirga sediminicola]